MGKKRRWRLGSVAFKGVMGLSTNALSMNRFEKDIDAWIRAEADEYSAMLEAQHRAEGLHAFLPGAGDAGVSRLLPDGAAGDPPNTSIQGGDDSWDDDSNPGTPYMADGDNDDSDEQPLLP